MSSEEVMLTFAEPLKQDAAAAFAERRTGATLFKAMSLHVKLNHHKLWCQAYRSRIRFWMGIKLNRSILNQIV